MQGIIKKCLITYSKIGGQGERLVLICSYDEAEHKGNGSGHDKK